MGRTPGTPEDSAASRTTRVCLVLVALAALLGMTLLLDSVTRSSATYDEVAYMRIGAHWWRTGEQTEITRMGSPLSFWKLQQAPVLWTLDRLGQGGLIDEPIRHQEEAPADAPRREPLGSGSSLSCSLPGGVGGCTVPGRWPWPPGCSP